MKHSIVLAVCLCAVISGRCLAQDVLSPLTSFGGGDGWLAPGDRPYLTTDNTQRGLAYNPLSGNLLVVNRAGALSVNVIDAASGASEGALNLTNVGGPGSGTFPLNMIGVADDGAIYACNLAITSTAEFRIHRWENESAVPTLDYRDVPVANGARVGDTLDVRGSGNDTLLLFGIAPGAGRKGYVLATTDGGAPYGAREFTFATTPPRDGDHHLGITFMSGDTVIGTRGGLESPTAFQPARVSTFNDFQADATHIADVTFATSTERSMDYAVIGGMPVLATVATDTSIVRLYDMTDIYSPVLLDSLTNLTGASVANGNGVGQVRWGEIGATGATLYALNTNNGIQAFNVDLSAIVPEPGTVGAMVVTASALLRRRKR